MLLNFTRCFLIIWLNSGSYSFSNESLVPGIEEIQIVYNKYNQISQNHIKVPKNLRALYKFHKTDIIEDYKGYYGERERNNKKIADLCYMDLLLFPVISPGTSPGTSQSVASELMLIMQYANNPSKVNKGFDITRHLHPGHSGAEIYILRGDYMRKPRVAKVLKKESAKDLESGFLELSNSLIALSLNPDPSNIKMTRILSAGYS